MAKKKRKLKPCPFCGSPAVVGYKAPPPLNIDEFAAFCVGCGASTEWYDKAKKARKAWNRRTKGGKND